MDLSIKNAIKIHYLAPAFNSSIVLIGLEKIGKDQLIHYDK